MRKGRILMGLMIVALVILVVLGIKYKNLSAEQDSQQRQIDNAFKTSLNFAMSGFAVDFQGSQDENLTEYSYNEAMSNLAAAAQLSNLTTYEDENDYLDISLFGLYKLMEQKEYKQSVVKRAKAIYDNLLKLTQNPADKEATKSIIKLTDEIREENM